MPSFLSKLFNRKPSSEDKSPRPPSTSDASLLEGKFEAVPPVITPTTPAFNIPSPPQNNKKKELDWQLSLNLPGPKEESSRALGVVFEADPDAQILVAESVIGERRLNPLETFLLVQACGQAIKERGLETLGIFVPHYHSASPAVQRKLISLFIQSLALKSPITTLSPTASSPVSAFESEIGSTRSPHDVAAVLRWGLRHLQLDNSSFGKDEQWYTQFLAAEKSSDYASRAFSQQLIPLLPPAHLHLLTAALEIFSSLAAHAEANGISGSKISKMLGLWLLAAPRVTEGDDFPHFYATWERWGRVMEHLFLAKIRDEAADHRMPARLAELVKHYPYVKTPSPDTHTVFLSPPHSSTRRFDALLVRIETEIPSSQSKDKNHPLRLVADALKASLKPSAPEGISTPELDLWESLKRHVSIAGADSETYPGLSNLFAEETVRFLSLIPASSDAKADDPPPFTLIIPSGKIGRRRSISLGARDKAAATIAAAHVKAASAASTAPSDPSTSPVDSIGIDWAQFSTSGFFENGGFSGSKLASTLLDNKDVEVTIPRNPSARRKLPPAMIPLPPSHSRGKSLDLPTSQKMEEKQVREGKSKAVKLEIVQLDEAFIDFWSDGLLDPISTNWPSFVVCKIKSSVPSQKDGKRVDWLVLEQQFVTPRPPPPPIVTTPEKETFSASRPRPNSPRPSFGSDSKSTKKKRFSFFTSLSSSSISSSSTSGTKPKKVAKGAKVGEMGEILKEEEEESSPLTAQTNGTEPSVSSAQVVATAATALGVAAATTVDVVKKHESAPTLVEDAANVAPSTESQSQPLAAVEEKPSLVEDVDNAQIANPAPETVEVSEPVITQTIEEEATAADTLVTETIPTDSEAQPVAPVEAEQKELLDLEPAPGLAKDVDTAQSDNSAPETTEAVAQNAAEAQETAVDPVAHIEAEEEEARLAAEKAAEEAERAQAEAEAARLAAEEEAREKAEQERVELAAQQARVAAQQAEQERIAAEAEAEAARLAATEEAARLEAEAARLAAEEAARLAEEKAKQEEEERARLAAEEARLAAEKERIAAEEAQRLAADEARLAAEKERIAAEEKARLEEEARLAAAEEAARLEAERLAAEAEAARLAAEEEARLAAEKERIAAEEAEKARLEEEARIAAAEEAARLEAERLEQERLAAEAEAEAARLAAAEEAARLEAERVEQERLAAEAEEAARLEAERIEQERLAEEARIAAAEEAARLEAERVEQERLAAEAEAARLAAAEEAARLAAVEEEARLEAERVEQERLAEEARIAAAEEAARLEAERVEQERLAAEAEAARLEAERVEQERLAVEAEEAARLEAERIEQERLAEEARIAAAEEVARLEAERVEQERLAAEAEAARLAAEEEARQVEEKAKQEEEERARLAAEEAARLAEEARIEAEKERIAAEEAEKARLEEEAERERVAAEAAAEAARLAAAEKEARLEAERVAEEARLAAEKERIAAEEAEKARLEEEAEKERIAAEAAAEAVRLAAAEEEARLEAERVAEESRLAAEKERVAAEEAEKARLEEEAEKERVAAEAAAEAARLAAAEEEARLEAERVAEEARLAAEKERIAAEQARLEQAAKDAAETAEPTTAMDPTANEHVEALREPAADNDKHVDLPAVPVVEARPGLTRGSTVISHLELTPNDDAPGGETPGPQVALDVAVDESGPANGNGVHEVEDASDKPE